MKQVTFSFSYKKSLKNSYNRNCLSSFTESTKLYNLNSLIIKYNNLEFFFMINF